LRLRKDVEEREELYIGKNVGLDRQRNVEERKKRERDRIRMREMERDRS